MLRPVWYSVSAEDRDFNTYHAVNLCCSEENVSCSASCLCISLAMAHACLIAYFHSPAPLFPQRFSKEISCSFCVDCMSQSNIEERQRPGLSLSGNCDRIYGSLP